MIAVAWNGKREEDGQQQLRQAAVVKILWVRSLHSKRSGGIKAGGGHQDTNGPKEGHARVVKEKAAGLVVAAGLRRTNGRRHDSKDSLLARNKKRGHRIGSSVGGAPAICSCKTLSLSLSL